MASVTGEFTVTSWDEDTYQELEGGGKLTRAVVTQAFSGGLAGTGGVQWLMCHAQDGTARFVGLQRIEGSIDGRDGSFVAETAGDFDGSAAIGTWSILPGSGAGGFVGLSGAGRFEAPLGRTASFQFDYGFE